MATSFFITKESAVDPQDLNSHVMIQTKSSDKTKRSRYFQKRALWTANKAPGFTMTDRKKRGSNQCLLVSFPVYNSMISSHRGLNDTLWERVMIKLKEPDNTKHIRDLTIAFKQSFTPEQANGIKIYNFYDDTETTQEVNQILDTIFNVIIAITMFLCFFSLCSSMSANLLD